MEKPISDFLVVCGNDMSSDLESYKLFVINEDPITMHENVLYKTILARDVSVRLTGGSFFLNGLLGRPNVVGGLDLDKKRMLTVPEDLVYLIKMGKPAIYLALPPVFDKLPQSMKDGFLGAVLKLFYLQRKNLEEQRKIMEQSGYQESEIRDRMSQSMNLWNENVTQTVQAFGEAMKNKLSDDIRNPRKKNEEEFGLDDANKY